MPHSALKVQPLSKPVREPSRFLPSIPQKKTSLRPKVRRLCEAPSKARAVPTKQEAAALAEQYRPAARKLALSMVTKWKCRIEKDELQSVIDLALCEAASRYNSSHGAAFMTFLYYHLKGKLIKTIAARADQGLVFIDDYERTRLSICGDDDVSDVRSSEWKQFAASDEAIFEPEEALYRQQLVDICYKACQRLRGIEREVIWRIYFENKELSQVTTEMGYSRGHLFRVRMRALEKIRKAVSSQCR